ncbi:MAG: cytidine deaminase [Myxococcales bacterium]|nr:cytidine deaminase [Myxococcales bacterium]
MTHRSSAQPATDREIRDVATGQPLPPLLHDLAEQARAAQALAYAPYSHFPVGAALRTEDGRVFVGANVENASYGLTVCAERTAVFQAVLAGARRIKAIAICTNLSPPAAPCGMCRQTLAEFAEEAEIVLLSPSGPAQQTTLSALLPLAFRPSALITTESSSQAEDVHGAGK